MPWADVSAILEEDINPDCEIEDAAFLIYVAIVRAYKVLERED